MLSYEEFKDKVVASIKDYLSKEYENAEVSITEATKNNDSIYDVLMVKREGDNIVPRLPLEPCYKRYMDQGIDDISASLSSIAKSYEYLLKAKTAADKGFDTDLISPQEIFNFESAKDKITCRLINAKMNEKYLADKPHTFVEDLAVIYSIHLKSDASIPITNDLMESHWGITVKDLHDIALSNMERVNPPKIMNIEEILSSLSGFPPLLPPPSVPIPMYILTNETKIYGASVILNSDMLEKAAETLGTDDFYILPSSVHEVIVIPADMGEDEEFMDMVWEINRSEVLPEEVLSDNIYAYDSKERTFYIVKGGRDIDQKEKEHLPEYVLEDEEGLDDPEL